MITRQDGEPDAWHQARLDSVERNRARLIRQIWRNHGIDAAARTCVAIAQAHPDVTS